jgi:hypothetical protein
MKTRSTARRAFSNPGRDSVPVMITTSRAGTPTTSSPGMRGLSSSQNSSASNTLDSSPSKESITAGGCPWIFARRRLS